MINVATLQTPLHVAAEHGSLGAVQVFIIYFFNILLSLICNTLTHVFTMSHAQVLIEKGAQWQNNKDLSGRNAWKIAKDLGHEEIVAFLNANKVIR
jgi:hypothetical protein